MLAAGVPEDGLGGGQQPVDEVAVPGRQLVLAQPALELGGQPGHVGQLQVEHAGDVPVASGRGAVEPAVDPVGEVPARLGVEDAVKLIVAYLEEKGYLKAPTTTAA